MVRSVMNQVKSISLIGLAILLVGCTPVRGISQGIIASEEAAQTQPRSSPDEKDEKASDEKANAEVMKAAAGLEDEPKAEVVEVDEPVAAPSNEELMATGTELYLKHYCGLCHTLESAGTTGAFGLTHDGLGPLLAKRLQDPNYAGTATTPAEYLMESLTDPAVYIVPSYGGSAHPMTDYDFLPPEELEALVQFLGQVR